MIAEILTSVGFMLVSVGLLWKGADWVVLSACRIARRFDLSDVVIGATVVALGTSAPEVVVTLVAAFTGHPDMAIGNVVGSNVFNVGVILGLCAAVWQIPTHSSLVRVHVPVLGAASLLMCGFLLDLELGRTEGLVMVVLLAVYIVWLVWRGEEELEEDEIPTEPATAWDGVVLLGGLAAVLGGAQLLVASSVTVARLFELPEWAISVTLVAAGTSMPELATALAACKHGRTSLMAGSLVGSDIFNVLGVLGLAALLQPLALDPAAMPSVVMMTGMVGLLLVFMRTGWRLSRAEGVILVMLALLRWGHDLALPLVH